MTSTAHDLGPVNAFEVGKPYALTVAGKTLLLVRKGDRFFAVRDVCPHAGARLSAGRLTGLACVERPDSVGSYERAGEIISCPWHGWEFDLTTGQSLVSPDRLRVATYPVKVVEGRVKVEI